MNYEIPHLHQKQIKLPNLGFLIEKYWFRIFIILIAYYILFHKDVSIQFNLNEGEQAEHVNTATISPQPASYQQAVPISPKNISTIAAAPPKKKKKWQDRRANTFSNLTFILSPDYGERKNIDPAIVQEKIQNCRNYVEKYADVAIKEMIEYGIPASITLAQALLESNVGESRLALESNNHFGIKCRSKCRGCTCRNYTDDDIYDMFRVFESPWESFREHSKLLQGDRYKRLLKLPKSDYEAWAHGLKKAGYATDKRYAPKLIQIIRQMELYRYDQQV